MDENPQVGSDASAQPSITVSECSATAPSSNHRASKADTASTSLATSFQHPINPFNKPGMLSRIVTSTLRSVARSAHVALKQSTSLRITTPLLSCDRVSKQQCARFMSSSFALRSSGSSDTQLLSKLKEEYKFEVDADSIKEPEWLTTFKKKSKFTIEDTAGSDEVALVRTFGNESIRIVFSIAEVMPNDELENEGQEENEEDASETPPRSGVRVAIIVTKPTGGGISFDAIADDGIMIENISIYDTPELAIDNGLESDWRRRALYTGPTFENLDADLQNSFEEWLIERDIGPELSEVIQDLAEYKEQQEYVRWLKQASQFIEA